MSTSDEKMTKEPVSGFIVNEKGEEIPITDEMVEQSLNEVKLQSMGVHTGINKIITDEMLEGLDDKK
jgi:hypothetical protein